MTVRMLGKAPYEHDERSLTLRNYLTTLAAPPPTVNWGAKVTTWPMFANDTLGDCTCAAAGHMIECWSANVGAEAGLTDAQIIAVYSAVTGYTPSNPASDQGAQVKDVLNYWRQTGVGGHLIEAYAAVDQTNHTEVCQAIDLFGGVDVGIMLPKAAEQMQGAWTDPPADLTPTWYETFCATVLGRKKRKVDPDWTAGSWGGHCIPAVDYDANGVTVVTWGQLYTVQWGFWDAYVDECWAIVSPDWFNRAGADPSGFNLTQLRADLAVI